MKEKVEGSYTEWDNIWVDFAEKDKDICLFTLNQPQTLLEFWQRGYAEDLLRLIEGKNYSKFCELGAGRATTSTYLSHAGYTDITLVDLAQQGLSQAKANFKRFNLPEPKLVQANVENTGLEEESFHCVYNIGLLEHFEDPSKTLAEAYRLLETGGQIFMPIVPEVPYTKSIVLRLFLNPLSIAKKLVKWVVGGKKQKGDNNMIRTDYNKEYYTHIAKQAGFTSVKCIPYNPYHRVTSNIVYENKIIVPLYKFWYGLKSGTLRFKTVQAFELCYLLVGEK